MANDTNSCVIEGNLVDDVSVREVNGQTVVNGTIGNNRYVKDDTDQKSWRQYAHFFNFAAWNGVIKGKIPKLIKGTRILINGHARQERWIDKTSGDPRSAVRFYAESLSVIDK